MLGAAGPDDPERVEAALHEVAGGAPRRGWSACLGALSLSALTFAAPGVEVPFVSGVIDCDGTSVRGNLRNVEPDAEHVHTGMKVRLTTYSLGTDDHGTEAIGFAFEPID